MVTPQEESFSERRKRQVVHISTVHPATDARIFYREALALRELGYEVTVCGLHAQDERLDGIQIRAMKAARHRPWRIATSWLAALGKVLRYKADLYQFHDPELIPAAILAKLVLRKHVVYDAHEDVSLLMRKDWLPSWLRWPLTATLWLVEHACARVVDAVLTPTPPLYEKYRTLARRSMAFINYPSPVFLADRDAAWRPFAERRNEVVHLGTLSLGRLKLVAQVAARFLAEHKDWSWTLIGLHPPLLAWFEANVPGELRDRLTAQGKVSHRQIAARLCRARIGVNYHPLDYRQIQVAIPVKVFEYLACGLPVVTTRVPVLVGLVQDCRAVTFAGEGVDSYLAGLRQLAARGDLAELSAEARRFGDEHFNCRVEGQKLADLYEDIWGRAERHG